MFERQEDSRPERVIPLDPAVNRTYQVQAELAAKLAEHIGEDTMSAREAEVLALVAAGNRDRDIGEQLCIAEETVKCT